MILNGSINSYNRFFQHPRINKTLEPIHWPCQVLGCYVPTTLEEWRVLGHHPRHQQLRVGTYAPEEASVGDMAGVSLGKVDGIYSVE